ncbi:MAG: hypothetical protein KDC00_05045 [Flavobacteriales bacterium]|nr:hypothetical protein [Flavobacteriales bacterium]
MFSLFRQRGPRGFDPVTRVYDAEKEARKERMARIQREGSGTSLDRDELSRRMRHSWQRQHRGTGAAQRYLITLGLVGVILFFIIKVYGLLSL